MPGTRNRREHFRITYPEAERPRFVFGTSISEIFECSERGVRFRTVNPVPAEGTRVAGRIAMRHGRTVKVSGTVVWADDDSVALHLDRTEIPFLAIMKEQLFLRRVASG